MGEDGRRPVSYTGPLLLQAVGRHAEEARRPAARRAGVERAAGVCARRKPSEWARMVGGLSLIQVPFFFKQWGGTQKKRAGRLLDGREWNELPACVQDENQANGRGWSEACLLYRSPSSSSSGAARRRSAPAGC